ncbi:hypothetical protein V6N13_097743 [Hibiscus sabdariffa]
MEIVNGDELAEGSDSHSEASNKASGIIDFFLHVDIDVGSSAVANGVLGLVIGVIRTLMVDMAFLVQGMINPKYSGNEMEEDQEADKKDDGISTLIILQSI